MKLEDEIQQKSFESPDHKLVINLIFTFNWLTSKMDPMFSKHGITSQQYNILRILRGQHPAFGTITLLKERMLDKQPDVSRLIDRLEIKELVKRKMDTKDRRKMKIYISEKGLRLLKKMEPELEDFTNLTSNLSKPEKVMINDLLDKMRG